MKTDKKEVGRPTKYNESYNEQIYKLCLLGAIDKEIADFFEISESTLNLWKLEYPKFSESIKKGKINANANVAESLYERACGYSHPDVHISNYQGEITITDIIKHYPPDTAAAFIFLKNRQSKDWHDRKEVAIEGGIEVTIIDMLNEN